jgi:ribonuclease P/MRP protein subunit RPP1
VIAAAPGVAEAAKFHRKLLKVPAAQPFRQFSRITVVVEDTVQAAALNSANPVLRSYDIVAVRPKNQKAFNQACTHLEVKERDKKITYIPLNSSSQKFAT